MAGVHLDIVESTWHQRWQGAPPLAPPPHSLPSRSRSSPRWPTPSQGRRWPCCQRISNHPRKSPVNSPRGLRGLSCSHPHVSCTVAYKLPPLPPLTSFDPHRLPPLPLPPSTTHNAGSQGPTASSLWAQAQPALHAISSYLQRFPIHVAIRKLGPQAMGLQVMVARSWVMDSRRALRAR